MSAFANSRLGSRQLSSNIHRTIRLVQTPSAFPSRPICRPFSQCLTSPTRTPVAPRLRPRSSPTTRHFATESNPQLNRPVVGSAGLAIGTLLFVAAYSLGSVYPPSIVELIFPRPAAAAPLDGTAEAHAKQREIEQAIWQLPFVQERLPISYPPDAETIPSEFTGPFQDPHFRPKSTEEKKFYIVRPYFQVPPHVKRNALTAGLLSGAGRIATPPVIFVRTDESASEIVLHVGRSLCGHDGIIHGGLIATLLDESMARTAIANFPARVGVTANLTVNYRAPTKADQFIVLKTQVESIKGRKAIISARVETLDGLLLAEASSVFIQPKYAHLLRGNASNKVLGIPDGLPDKQPAEAVAGK